MANEIYRDSWWGNPTASGWGNIYYSYIVSFYARNYSDRVIADGGTVESLNCVDSGIDLQSNPIITLLGDAFIKLLHSEVYSDDGATAFDELFFGDLTSSIDTVNQVNVNRTGVYNVLYNVTDPAGIASPQVSREVYIKSFITNDYETRIAAEGGTVESEVCIDTAGFPSNPIITLIGNAYIELLIGNAYTESGATAFDEFIFGDLTSQIDITDQVNVNRAGVQDVLYDVTLEEGSATQVRREVYIKSILTDRYETRLGSDGATIESEVCIDGTNFSKFNWGYNFRVVDDGGIIESLGCVTL